MVEISVPFEISKQVSLACDVIQRHLGPSLKAIHLFSSAVHGGLKPKSDIDLLVTVGSEIEEGTRQTFMMDLLEISAPPAKSEQFRALEVTVVVQNEVMPWRYPARRELQYGEWLRQDFLEGKIESAVVDPDLAILLKKARQHSLPLFGPPADALFDPVPESDFLTALADSLKLWEAPSDWAGDERNVILTLARIWYSVVTGEIAPKDVAADWALERLPVEYQSILFEARQAYLGKGEDQLASRPDQTTDSILYIKSQITQLLTIMGTI